MVGIGLLAAVASSLAGIVDAAYWFGGYLSAYNTIVQTRFDTDATAALSATLTDGTDAVGGFANGQTAAYIAGNDWGTPVWGTDVIGKLTFATGAYALISATLSEITWGDAGASNSGTAGYFTGGQGRDGASSVILDKIDKLAFADDSCAVITPTLTAGRYYPSGAANSGTAAYWIGGSVSGGGIDNINKTAFSDDSTAMLTGGSTSLSQESEYGTSCADSGTAAYTHIGQTSGTKTQRINKLTFSSETVANTGNLLDTAAASMGSSAQKGAHAYFVGGNTASGRIDVIEKLSFADDSCAAITPTLPNATSDFCGASCDVGMV